MTPVLSILVPYYHDDPSDLLKALLAQSGPDVQICLYDDGTGNAAVNRKLSAIAASAPKDQVELTFAALNQGRSAARNALFKTAKAPWILFLDADMLPSDSDFVSRYKDAIKSGQVDIIFGGFLMSETAAGKDTALHHAFSKTSDCLSASARTAKGAQYVCSSNLAMRAEVLEAEPFDTEFTGWGWEDSEWAARAAKRYRLLHLENPAYHLGLETTQTLLSRFKTSAANYDRFTRRHQNLAQTLTLYRLVQRLKYVPGQFLLRPLLRVCVQNRVGIVPMRLRLLALKLWRASWYAAYARSSESALKKVRL